MPSGSCRASRLRIADVGGNLSCTFHEQVDECCPAARTGCEWPECRCPENGRFAHVAVDSLVLKKERSSEIDDASITNGAGVESD